MTDDMNDEMLREYLEGRSPVSDAYKQSDKPEPSPRVDRAVLAEARTAARKDRYRTDDGPEWQRWVMPAALAATVALCVALVVEVSLFDPVLKRAREPAPVLYERTDALELRPVEAADEVATLDMLLELEDLAREPLQEVPMSTRFSMNEDTMVAAKGRSAGAEATAAGVASSFSADVAALSPWPDPDVWLAGIRYLEAQGNDERAAAELQKFRAVYPDYPINGDVQGTDEE
jgi:hypothetical protein